MLLTSASTLLILTVFNISLKIMILHKSKALEYKPWQEHETLNKINNKKVDPETKHNVENIRCRF